MAAATRIGPWLRSPSRLGLGNRLPAASFHAAARQPASARKPDQTNKSLHVSNCVIGSRGVSGARILDKSHVPVGAPEPSRRGSPFTPDVIAAMMRIVGLIREEVLIGGTDREKKLLEFQHPAKLQELFDFEIREEAATEDDLFEACQKVIRYSVKTSHPMWFNQFYKGVDPYSLTGAWLTESLNTNAHTFEVSPAFNAMECYITKKICSYIGYEDGEALFLPGGNIANMVGIHLGRFVHNKNIKKEGMYCHEKPIAVLTSAEAHYGSGTASHFLGFGMENVVSVDCDEKSHMCMIDLENKIKQTIEEGRAPCVLVATAGTTVMGAFDPLDACADICEKYNMWLHVDAAVGGGVLVSDTYKHLMKGVNRADSVLWNIHKMLGAQLQSTVLAVKRKGILLECNGLQAEYQFQKDKHYDVSYDVGDKSVQCGRKADAFKVWLMWKSLGASGLQWRVDHAFDMARYMASQLKVTEGFRLLSDEFESLNVCFWYIPPRLRNQPETPEWWQEMHKIAPKIKEKMMTTGLMMIGYCPLESRGYVNFFRMVVNGVQLDKEDVDYVIKTIDELGRDL